MPGFRVYYVSGDRLTDQTNSNVIKNNQIEFMLLDIPRFQLAKKIVNATKILKLQGKVNPNCFIRSHS